VVFLKTTAFGMDPLLAGFIVGIPRLFDAITDPVMGYISDNTSSQWGRRRPYILLGAIFTGIVFAVLWQVNEGNTEMFNFWYLLGFSILLIFGNTIFSTPLIALGYEMTSDYNERTRLMSFANTTQVKLLEEPPVFRVIYRPQTEAPNILVSEVPETADRPMTLAEAATNRARKKPVVKAHDTPKPRPTETLVAAADETIIPQIIANSQNTDRPSETEKPQPSITEKLNTSLPEIKTVSADTKESIPEKQIENAIRNKAPKQKMTLAGAATNHLIFLVDVSSSMNKPEKLPL